MAEELSQPENWRAVLPGGRQTPGFNLILISRIKKKKKNNLLWLWFAGCEAESEVTVGVAGARDSPGVIVCVSA